jgi:cytochrome c oxidase subunit I+III
MSAEVADVVALSSARSRTRWRGRWRAVTSVSADAISMRFVVTSIGFLVAGGIAGLVMRTQLSIPSANVLDPEGYAQAFTFHGTTMVMLFALPFLLGLVTGALPAVLRVGRLAMPRLHAFAYWLYLFGGLIFLASLASPTPPDAGWSELAPLSGPVYQPRNGTEYWTVAMAMVGLAVVAIAIGVLVTSLGAWRERRVDRGVLGWAAVSASAILLVAAVPLLTALVLLESDRLFDTGFFDQQLGGDPLLWEHLFFGFAVPAFVALLVLGAGLVSRIVEGIARRPLVGGGSVRGAFVAAALIAIVSWGRELMATGVSGLAQSVSGAASLLLVVPVSIMVWSWLTTLWAGPATFGATTTFVVGTILFAAVAIVATVATSMPAIAVEVGGTVFVVGLLHATVLAGVVFPGLAAVVSRPGADRGGALARAGAWVALVGSALFVAPMFLLGLRGSPRRAYTYDHVSGWTSLNVVETVGAVILAVGLLVTVAAALAPWVADRRRGALAAPEPPVADDAPTLVPPEAVVETASPLPVALAASVGIAMLGMLAYAPWVAGAGGVLVVVIGGLWFAGSGVLEAALRPAMWLALAVGVAVVLAFAAAYAYLALAASHWPPLLKFGYPPGVVLPTVVVALAVAGAVWARLAGRGAFAAVVLAAAALVAGAVEIVWLGTLPFQASEDSYSAATFLLGLAAVAALGALVLAALASVVVRRRARAAADVGRWDALAAIATATAIVVAIAWFTTSIVPVIAG